MRDVIEKQALRACDKRCTFVLLLAGVVFAIILGGRANACHVVWVGLYVGETEGDATENSDTTVTLCKGVEEYWFRVRWKARDDGWPGGDNDFHVEVHDVTEDISLWEDEHIEDEDPGDTQQEVNEVNSPAEALEEGVHTLRAEAKRRDVGEWVDSDDSTVTVVDKECTPGYRYVRASSFVSLPDGITGTIMTRYGNLCCESCGGDANGSQAAWVNLQKNTIGFTQWGQLGYGKQRDEGASTTYAFRYWEVEGTGVGNYDRDRYAPESAPIYGTTHTYKIKFDKTEGKWDFYVGASLWASFDHTWWGGKQFNYVAWGGEIKNIEDDMPGTSSLRCSFTGCGYWDEGGDYYDAGFTNPGSYFTSDFTEWGWAHVSGTAFDIWDKNPGQ